MLGGGEVEVGCRQRMAPLLGTALLGTALLGT
ncbi:MAG: hypothetical protein ACI90M_001873, partial [Candidatus Azotimanducaceae bacterium]